MLLASLALAGCGSGAADTARSLAGLTAAEHKLAADENAGQYASACAAFTPELERVFGAYRYGGCAGFLKESVAAAHALCRAIRAQREPRVSAAQAGSGESVHLAPAEKGLRASCASEERTGLSGPVPADVRLSGATAYQPGAVYARYEGGSWHFARGASRRDAAALEAQLRKLGRNSGDALLTAGARPRAKPTTISPGGAPQAGRRTRAAPAGDRSPRRTPVR